MSFYRGPTLVRDSWQFVVVAEINESCVVSAVSELQGGAAGMKRRDFSILFLFLKRSPPLQKAKWEN